MGLFDFLKTEKDEGAKAENTPVMLGAPAKGTFVAMEQVPDEVFSQGIMGWGGALVMGFRSRQEMAQ